jgi:histidinol dehydrogenase
VSTFGRIERRPASSQPADAVRAIIADVRERGDAALLDLTERYDGVRLDGLRVPRAAIEAAPAALDADLLDALRTSMRNVRLVAEAQVREPIAVTLPEGQEVVVAEQPVARAGMYAPGGRAAYPSSVVMCAVTARVAGVDEIVVCSPPGPPGEVHPLVLAACALCEVDEVYRLGGAQAVAALAFGTESVGAVDLIAGPGNDWVTEAKRQVAGAVGIDGLAGPSELLVIAGADADAELIALDLLAQAEHGEECLVGIVSTSTTLVADVRARVDRLAGEFPSVAAVAVGVGEAADMDAALAIAEEIAPEHLELVGAEAEALAGRVRRAGCVFVGRGAATAFGDYVAGSNHVLPTGGAARFQSALSPATFRRRMARVSLPGEAAARLAPAGATLARAEGFPVHAESMERRA